MPTCSRIRWSASLIAATAALAGCGEDESSDDPLAGFDEQVRASTASEASDFPATDGRSMREMTAEVVGQASVGLATPSVSPGSSRLAFGVIDEAGDFVFGPTAVYVAESPKAKALGPFPAPADPLVTEPAYRSEQAAVEGDIFAAIYDAEVEIGDWKRAAVLTVTEVDGELLGAGTQVAVIPQERDPVVGVGDAAPEVNTDTVDDGPIEQIETRSPPDTMHETDFADVVDEKPVALLFATPQLCESRTCGPVTDIAAQLQREYGDQMEFIHQEVFVDNTPQKGFRPPLRKFGLQTEPWLFVIDSDGEVTARLQGSFGLEAFEEAIQSGLQ